MSNILAGIRNLGLVGAADPRTALVRDSQAIAGTRSGGGSRRALCPAAAGLLRIAWQTELAARLGDAYDDGTLRRVSANTLPVQAYYAVYNAAQALVTTTGDNHGEQHAAVHKDFESQRVRRAVGPWAVTLQGDPEDTATCELAPAVCRVEGFNPMELYRTPEEYLAVGSLRPSCAR